MSATALKINQLHPDMLVGTWLWHISPADRDGVLKLKPVKLKKTDKFSNRLIGTEVLFADGSKNWALIEGIDMDCPEFSRHNRQIYLWINSYEWFHLAQYFDSAEVKSERGEKLLSKKIDKSLESIFPISFDIRHFAKTYSSCLQGTFEINPRWGISRDEQIDILMRELDKAK